MAITYVNSAASAGTLSEQATVANGSPQNNDIIILALLIGSNATQLSAPSGFTELLYEGLNGGIFTVSYKIASNESGDYVYQWTNDVEYVLYRVIFRGINTSAPIDNSSASEFNLWDGTTCQLSNFEPITNNTMAILIGAVTIETNTTEIILSDSQSSGLTFTNLGCVGDLSKSEPMINVAYALETTASLYAGYGESTGSVVVRGGLVTFALAASTAFSYTPTQFIAIGCA